MLVTESGIVTLVRPLQFLNAEDPMLVTLFGIVTLVRLLQLENTFESMPVTSLPLASLLGSMTTTALDFSLKPVKVLPKGSFIMLASD